MLFGQIFILILLRLLFDQICIFIGLHAVQFGNNWMRKIPRTAKLDEAIGRVQFGSPRNFLNPIISKLDKHVVLLPINYRASKNSLFKAKLNVRAKTIQFILNRPFYSCGSVTRPMNGSEAAGDFVLIQSSLLFLCKCRLVSITTTQFT